jgi:hypothetical protein
VPYAKIDYPALKIVILNATTYAQIHYIVGTLDISQVAIVNRQSIPLAAQLQWSEAAHEKKRLKTP